MKCAGSKVSRNFYEVRCRSAVEDAGTVRDAATKLRFCAQTTYVI
jgi:hypothetical protein